MLAFWSSRLTRPSPLLSVSFGGGGTMADEDADYDADLSREFCRLRDDVYDRLRQGRDVPNARYSRVGQWLVLPSFDNPYSWDILRDRYGVYTLYFTRWRFDMDAPPFESRAERSNFPVPFVPTIEAAAVPMASHRLRELLDALGGISIPIRLYAPLPAEDETAFELLIGGSGGGCRLDWFGDVPLAWQPLEPLIRLMAHEFDVAWSSRRE
jgi:hypothetical protein